MISASAIDRIIRSEGNKLFKTLGNYNFLPSRERPIRMYLHGVGAFAAVLKAEYQGEYKAVRCFFDQNRALELRFNRLSQLNFPFLLKFRYLPAELLIEEQYLNVLDMEWYDGIPINKFVASHRGKKAVLSALQNELMKVHQALEELGFAHGDLQAGNILVKRVQSGLELKLIDYDCFFIPELTGERAPENGHTSYQHPKRTLQDYDHRIDRFSVLILLNGIEVAKWRPELWEESHGFNDGDNFLFRGFDFINLDSPIWNVLVNVHQNVSVYTNRIKLQLLSSEVIGESVIDFYKNLPIDQDIHLDDWDEVFETPMPPPPPTPPLPPTPPPPPPIPPQPTEPPATSEISVDNKPIRESSLLKPKADSFLIESDLKSAMVYNSLLQPIGPVPLHLSISEWDGKIIIVKANDSMHRIALTAETLSYRV